MNPDTHAPTPEEKFREVLIRFAQGEATREEVRAADPLRDSIKEAARLIAQAQQ